MYEELQYLKDFYVENAKFIADLNRDCRFHRHNSEPLKLTEEKKEKYAEAVIVAAERLLLQNPKTVFLPIRGGALHGNDIYRTAYMLAMLRENHEYGPSSIEIYASGIGTKENVKKNVKHQLSNLKKAESKYPEEYDFSNFTIIDSAYTGMAYRKLLGVFREMFPSSKINGIVLRDSVHENEDINGLKYTHEKHKGGDFFSVKVSLPYEDMDLMYHDISRKPGFECIINLPTLDYYKEWLDIMYLIMDKIGFPSVR